MHLFVTAHGCRRLLSSTFHLEQAHNMSTGSVLQMHIFSIHLANFIYLKFQGKSDLNRLQGEQLAACLTEVLHHWVEPRGH